MTADEKRWSTALKYSQESWRRHLGGSAPVGTNDVARLLASKSLPTLFQATARNAPDLDAVTIGPRSITHGELDDGAARIAGWLKRTGITPDTRVLIASENSVEMLLAYMATLRTGAVALLCNPTLTVHELVQVTARSHARIAFASGPAFEHLAVVMDAEKSLSLLIDLESKRAPEVCLEELEHSPYRLDAVAEEVDRPAILTYTSGTTGVPKAVVLSHRNLVSSIRAAMLAWRWEPSDILVHALPLFHQHGLGGIHATLMAGSRAHVLERFDAGALCETIAGETATVLFAVPAMYERIADWAASHATNLSSLRVAVCGSAPLSEDLAARTRLVLGDVPLERYGTTESGLNVSNPYAGPRKPGSVGVPLPGVQLAVVDDRGMVVEPGIDGEIVLRGPQVFSGYADVADSSSFYPGDWFRTGDVGRVDPADGYLTITGRAKELIITGGMNVYPREVELALERDPAVVEAAVIGLPSRRWGEEVVAVVVPASGQDVDAAALIRAVRSRLSPYKCPKRVITINALPRNAMGKLLRTELPKLVDGREPEAD